MWLKQIFKMIALNICIDPRFAYQKMDSDKAVAMATSDEEHEEIEEEEEADKAGQEADQVAVGAVLRNPQVMAALQARLDSMVGNQSGYVKVHVANTWE